LQAGFAVASVDFRQSPEARFPAQVHDIKAAIRFLRAKAGAYGYRTDKIAVAGTSSGGHLAALVGVTNGHSELEGEVGEFLRHSSNAGDHDPQMPINQSHELDGAYKKHALEVAFRVVHGAAHGGDVFFSSEQMLPVLEFLRRTLSN
jgi:predicted esterase